MEKRNSEFVTHFNIANKLVGPNEPVFIIAEAGVAHFGNIEKAKRLVDMSVDAGADAFKTQAFHTDMLVSNHLPEWRERLRSKEVGFEFIDQIKDYCDECGILFLCTPHESSVLSWLDKWNVPAIKIGSGERGNTPFLNEIVKLNKPVILSTGMYKRNHIDQALEIFSDAGLKELALLHCVTSYPTPHEDVNLKLMNDLRKGFSGPVGYSDHTKGHEACMVAVSMGAQLIEKHITLDFNIPNAQDWKVSCGPDDFTDFVRSIRNIEVIRGDGKRTTLKCEEGAIVWALKSLVAAKNLKIGHRITESDIIAKRPGNGISPDKINIVIGRVLRSEILKDEKIKWSNLL
jgi:N-acetylneuraminate synthase/N,N'-diacetyllegionaminate synthase